VREGGLQPDGVDHLARGLAAEEPALQQVRLAADPGGRHGIGAASRPLVLEQPFKDVERGLHRRHRCAALCLAVPAAIGQLLCQQPIHKRRHVHAEVGASGHHVSVDARLNLAREERVITPREIRPG
jgi:hypothetical protein